MSFIRTALRKFARDEKGATAIEYGLIAALIAFVCMGGFSLIGSNLRGTLDYVGSKLDSSSSRS